MLLVSALLVLAATARPAADRFVETADHTRIWYTSRGKGSPIVVIHGGPGMDHGSLAGDLIPLEKKHRVIYYDQRGGGRSTLATSLSIDDHVRDLEALRQQLGLAKMTLLAHSFGPAIAALYAIRYPDHVDRMIFLGPIPPRKGAFFEEYGANLGRRLTPEQQKRAAELAASYESSSADPVAVCREYWSIETPPRLAEGHAASMVKSDLCTAPPEAIRYGMTKTNDVTFSSLGDWDWTADLARVTVPVLIIHGEEDAIPLSMVSEWAHALPNARLLKLPHTGHFPHAENPEVVFPAMESFLKTRVPRRGAE